MTKIRRKTIRPSKSAKKARTDHPAGCRINDAEKAQVMSDIADIKQASGHGPSLGSYTKHALLSHPRYRRLEVGLRKLLADDAVGVIDLDDLTRKVLDAEAGFDSISEGTFDRTKAAIGEALPALLDPAKKFYADVKALLEGL